VCVCGVCVCQNFLRVGESTHSPNSILCISGCVVGTGQAPQDVVHVRWKAAGGDHQGGRQSSMVVARLSAGKGFFFESSLVQAAVARRLTSTLQWQPDQGRQ
jgi:hypothetical protein